MISAVLAILSTRYDELPIIFQPKIGTKYRYQTTEFDGEGKIVIPEFVSLVTIFKIAGFKDGQYTVHQLLEYTVKGKIQEPELRSTFQIDSGLRSKMTSTVGGKVSDSAMAIGNAIGAQFLVTFPKEFPAQEKESSEKLDLTKFVKSMFPTIPEDQLFLFSKIEGNRTSTLENFDALSATFRAKTSFSIVVTPPEESGGSNVGLTCDVGGKVVIERSSGMPLDYNAKTTIVATFGKETLPIKVTGHLVRI